MDLSAEKFRSSKLNQVFLTTSVTNKLELNWIPLDSNKDHLFDRICLYSVNPQSSDMNNFNEIEPVIAIDPKLYPEGYYKSKLKLEKYFPGNWEFSNETQDAVSGPHEFPHWIVGYNNGNIVDMQSLKIQPTWMGDYRNKLRHQRIGNLLIPGTHNSGSFQGIYCFYKDFVLPQHDSFYEQLVWGIRYFDIRVGYYEGKGFYINHDIIRVQRIDVLFRHIKKFLQVAPQEVIILDFHRFPYPRIFESQWHDMFIDLIKSELGEYAFLKPSRIDSHGPTLDEIWAAKKNLIICYADYCRAESTSWLWYPIRQIWTNSNEVEVLKCRLSSALKAEHQPFTALMAELTPARSDIFKLRTLKKMAQEVNRNVTKWVRDEWPDKVNIVATDFFRGNDLINVAICVNINRSPEC